MADVAYSVYIRMDHDDFKAARDTVAIYREAVSFLIDVCLNHCAELSALKPDPDSKLSASKLVMMEVEAKIHSVKGREASYPAFDERFYKFPSYYRRSAIASAWGHVKAYMSLVANWESGGRKGRKPRLNRHPEVFPCLYRDNTYVDSPMQLKLYKNHDWVWVSVTPNKSDLRYVMEAAGGAKISAPVLVKMHKKFKLVYSIRLKRSGEYVKDKDVKLALGVDLGVNTDAVCSILRKDGTVIGRLFINHPVEKDRLYTDLHAISNAQKHGSCHCHRLWRFVNHYNSQIAKDTASQIVRYAVEHDVQVIVLEYLNMKGKISGRRAQRIALWRKRDIAHRIEQMGSRFGIRVSYVCPYGTSKYAYDGSGEVVRDPHNHQLCTFKTGKKYNCDLSASYNIASRYFIRVYQKTIHANVWLQMQAKVPELCKRTLCTLSTLIRLVAVLSDSSGSAETRAVSVVRNSEPSKGATLELAV